VKVGTSAKGGTMAREHDDDREPTLDDNPGLEHDEATAEGKMMTGEGSRGSVADVRRMATEEQEDDEGPERTG
jgi:hypothetical protein